MSAQRTLPAAKTLVDIARTAKTFLYQRKIGCIFFEDAIVLNSGSPKQIGVAGERIGGLIFPTDKTGHLRCTLCLGRRLRPANTETTPVGSKIGPGRGHRVLETDGVEELFGLRPI